MGEEFVRAPDLIVERSSEDDSDSEQPVDLLVVAQGIEADIAQAEEDCPRLLHKTLRKYRFYDLSQEDQVLVLRRQLYNEDGLSFDNYIDVNAEDEDRSVWVSIIRSDNVAKMEALLQNTPLYAVNKRNIPDEFQWINPECMKNCLYTRNARWFGETCDYDKFFS